MEHIIEKARSKQVAIEKNRKLDDITTILDDEAIKPTHNMAILTSPKRRERPTREEEHTKLENTPTSRVSNESLSNHSS